MKVGTRSILFGVHQFIWHPVTVWIAWWKLYGVRPTWRETVCIVIHDWGYWGCESMDGPDGSNHPKFGADLATRLFGPDKTTGVHKYYYLLVMWHSRHLAEKHEMPPSKLCWPDKTSMLYDPDWFYLLRARASGEIREYRRNAVKAGVALHVSDRVWLQWLKQRLARLAETEARKFR